MQLVSNNFYLDEREWFSLEKTYTILKYSHLNAILPYDSPFWTTNVYRIIRFLISKFENSCVGYTI